MKRFILTTVLGCIASVFSNTCLIAQNGNIEDKVSSSRSQAVTKEDLAWSQTQVGWQLHHKDIVLGEYRTSDSKIRRPYWCNLKSLDGQALTRHHPASGDKANGGDHADMHPGLWLAYADIEGVDFWRNQGTVEHVESLNSPTIREESARLTVRNRFLNIEGKPVCEQTVQYTIALDHDNPSAAAENLKNKRSWWMGIESSIVSEAGQLSFGNQEEMGLGLRVAADITEKATGRVTSNLGAQSAKEAWGKVAQWWSYGNADKGIFVSPRSSNKVASWGHTRDYGLLVVNPTCPPSEQSTLVIKPGEALLMNYDLWFYCPVE